MTTTYVVNNTYPLTFTFRNASGTLADPSTVAGASVDPLGVSHTLSLSSSSTGIYTATWTPTIPGTWTFSAWGTGALVAQIEDASVYVHGSAVHG